MPETEAEKVVVRIMPLLEGKTVIDLGCGRRPITRWAVGVDDSSETKHLWPGTVIAKIDPDSHQLDAIGQFDVVFSSHALEHIRAPIGETLRYWFRLVKPGGRLVMYLPNEARYVFDPKNPIVRNPGHFHYLTPEVVRWAVEQLPVEIEKLEEDPLIYDHYSFLVIARRK